MDLEVVSRYVKKHHSIEFSCFHGCPQAWARGGTCPHPPLEIL